MIRVLLKTGETISEGGFAKNKVSSAALLDVQKATDSKGKTYYKYDILSRAGGSILCSCLSFSRIILPDIVWCTMVAWQGPCAAMSVVKEGLGTVWAYKLRGSDIRPMPSFAAIFAVELKEVPRVLFCPSGNTHLDVVIEGSDVGPPFQTPSTLSN